MIKLKLKTLKSLGITFRTFFVYKLCEVLHLHSSLWGLVSAAEALSAAFICILYDNLNMPHSSSQETNETLNNRRNRKRFWWKIIIFNIKIKINSD